MSNVVQRCQPLLGTYVEVSISGNVADSQLIDYSNVAFAEISRIHELLGFHQADSELTRLNNKMASATNHEIEISEDLANVLKLALMLHHHSNGVFDVTIAPYLVATHILPAHSDTQHQDYGTSDDLVLEGHLLSNLKPVCIDLGGIAKGYAVDCAFAVLPSDVNVTINAGGDMRTNQWKDNTVLLKYAARSGAVRQALMLNQALASSATYYSGEHTSLINPLTKQHKKISGSVSVFSSSAMLSDALTKIVSLMPRKQAQRLVQYFGANAINISRFGFKTVY